MPKFEYNHRTGQMELKKPTGIEFHHVVGGLKVVDFDLPASFIILRDGDNIGYANGRAAVSVKIFDIRKARMIADRVKRILPHSKYTDYTYFCKGVKTTLPQMDPEDSAMLEMLMESYGETAINESVKTITENMLNEGYGPGVSSPNWSDNQTRGAQDVGPNKKRLRGLSGFVKTLPSMAISFAICPPMALIQLCGAVRHRMEKKWLGRLINSKTWLDFIATPSDKKEELKQKMKDAFAKKTQFYYVTLDNNEILKVPAVSTLEAKDMVLAITRKDIIPRYADWAAGKGGIKHVDSTGSLANGIVSDENPAYISGSLQYDASEQCKMWAVKFNDGQCCYAFGHEGERDKIKEKAEESKKAIIDYYKKIKLKGKPGDDNEKDKTIKHDGIGTDPEDGTEYLDEMFAYPVVDDMIEIKNTGMYKLITEDNETNFSTPTTSRPGPWQPLDYPIYEIPIGVNANNGANMTAVTLRILAPNPNAAGVISKRILADSDFRDIVARQLRTFRATPQWLYDKEWLKTPETDSSLTKDITPMQFITRTIKICDCEFNITCIDDREYDSQGQPSGGNNPMTRNETSLIFYSQMSDIEKRIGKCIESAYNYDDVDKNVKDAFVERMKRAQGITDAASPNTTTDVQINLRSSGGTPPPTPPTIKRNDFYSGDWQEVANAGGNSDTTINDCVVKRPNGEVLKSQVTVKIAA